MSITKLIATEVAMPTTAGTASSISNATCVRLCNTANQLETVSISTAVGAAPNIIFTLPHQPHVEFLQKSATDVIFASSSSVKASKVGFTN